MRYFNHIICCILAIILAMPALAEQKQGEGLNTSQIVVGHIKDSYHSKRGQYHCRLHRKTGKHEAHRHQSPGHR